MTTTDAQPLARDSLRPIFKLARRALRFAWVGAIAFVLGAAAAVLLWYLRPTRYQSQTVLYYREGLQWADSHGEPHETARRVGQRLKDSVLSRPSLRQVILDLQLYSRVVGEGRIDDAIDEMLSRTTFKVNEGDTFTLAYTGESPDQAQRATALLAELLIAQNARLRAEQLDAAKGFLDAQTRRNEEVLRSKEAELARFLASHPEFLQEGAPTGAAVRVATRAGSGDAVAGSTAADRPILRDEEDRIRQQLSAAADPRVELVAQKEQAQANLAAARRHLAEQRKLFTEKHPSVAAAAAAVADAEQAHQRSVDALRTAEKASSSGAAKRGAGGRDVPPPGHAGRVPAGPATLSSDATRSVVELETEYARLTREVAEERERVRKLDTKQFVATMAASSLTSGDAAQITVVDPAYRPARAMGPSRTLLLLASLAGSFALGLAAALGCAALDDHVYDRTDVERLGTARVLIEIARLPRRDDRAVRRAPGSTADTAQAGATAVALLRAMGDGRDAGRSPPRLAPGPGDAPALPAASSDAIDVDPTDLVVVPPTAVSQWQRAAGSTGGAAAGRGASPRPRRDRRTRAGEVDERLLLLRAPDSATAASFRVLRHRLAERGDLKTVLVTSPVVGEGKTTCALNLALALGEAGRARVLLLDANFRRPALAELFGVAAPVADPSRLWEPVERVTPWLHVAFAPEKPLPPFADAPSVAARLDELGAEGYDSIVIDGPPVLGTADANLIEESVSAVLLTVRSRHSQASSLRDALDQIGTRKVLGVVLMEG